MPFPSAPGAICAVSLLLAGAALAAPSAEQLFLERCAICHQPNGQGAPPVYPPLAGSDFLKGHRTEAIKAICEGLSGPLTVRGQQYNNVMPAQMLDDEQVAAVLTYVLGSWGNEGAPVKPDEVREARAQTKFATYAELVKAGSYAPLPPAPDGWALRQVAELPEFCTRLAGHPGHYYVLAQNGSVFLLDVEQGAVTPIIRAAEYLDPSRGDVTTMGMTEGPDGRLWIVSNQRLKQTIPYQNEIVIYRTDAPGDGLPARPQVWLKTQYPYGIGSYNHGVSNIAFGPDGMLYVSSGSRTDGGETGKDPNYSTGGEVELTAGVWRIDPKAEAPKIEVIVHGIRNAYGFAWDGAGRLFTVSNGPDANAPEEMDLIVPGRHYGFPYQYANWPAEAGKPYPYTPVASPGLKFTWPAANLGPDGGGTAEGLYTFDPHSSPAGVMWCGDDFAEPLRNRFLMTRFGNLLGPPAAPEDVGFDVLSLKMEERPEGAWALHAHKLLGPLGRPLDVIRGPGATVLLLEYTRPTTFKDKLGWLPGRILQLSPKK